MFFYVMNYDYDTFCLCVCVFHFWEISVSPVCVKDIY